MSDIRPPLPAPLAGLKESAQPLPSDGTSWCTLHGAQSGLNCSKCDEHFPDQVAARALPAGQVVVTGITKEMLDAAVKQAVAEAIAFEHWKASPEGQAAAASASSAKVDPLHPAEITSNPEQVT